MRYSNLFAEEVEEVFEFTLCFHKVYSNIPLVTDKELHAGVATGRFGISCDKECISEEEAIDTALS